MTVADLACDVVVYEGSRLKMVFRLRFSLLVACAGLAAGLFFILLALILGVELPLSVIAAILIVIISGSGAAFVAAGKFEHLLQSFPRSGSESPAEVKMPEASSKNESPSDAADAGFFSLESRQDLMRELLDATSDLISFTDSEGKIVYINPAGRDMLGFGREDDLGEIEISTLHPAWAWEILSKEGLRESKEKGVWRGETAILHSDGKEIPISQVVMCHRDGNGEVEKYSTIIRDISEHKKAQQNMSERIESLTLPLNEVENLRFEDLFDMEQIQKIQDAFALATGVASIITDPQGRPLTTPSNFCRLCNDIIRKTEKGLANCMHSDAMLGKLNPDGPVMSSCLSGGLWDGGAGISVGNQHIANWLIGQVRNEHQNDEQMMCYAREIGADKEEFAKALAEVNTMTTEQFAKVCDALFLVANQLSELAYKNVQQARAINDLETAEDALRLDEMRLEALVKLAEMTDASVTELCDFALEQAVNLTSSEVGYLAFLSPDEKNLTMHSWSGQVMEQCKVADYARDYVVEHTGLWSEVVRGRQPVINNDYQPRYTEGKGYPKGHISIFRHMCVPVFDENKIVALVGVGNKVDDYDLSDVRQLTLLMDGMWRILHRWDVKAEREKLLKTLANKNEELESIVYVSSHDLRSPLVNIQGFSRELGRCCKEFETIVNSAKVSDEQRENLNVILNDEIPESLSYIEASVAKMDMLLSGLLHLSRVGRVQLDIKSLDMNQIVQEVTDAMHFQIDECGAEIVMDELAPCLGDWGQTSQVFSNLLDNALKYRHPERVPSVVISSHSENSKTIYCVADNGIGIESRHQEKIFEVFHRLNPRGDVAGEGVGLAVVKRVIERQNGRVWVESQAGQGSVFYIELPNQDSGEVFAKT